MTCTIYFFKKYNVFKYLIFQFDEDDNIDLIEEIIEDDDDSFDGVSTGPPSSSKSFADPLLRYINYQL